MSIEYYYVNDLNKLYNAAVGNKTDGGEYHMAMMEAHDNLEEYIRNIEHWRDTALQLSKNLGTAQNKIDNLEQDYVISNRELLILQVEISRLTADLALRDEKLALTEFKLCNIDRSARVEIARRDEKIADLHKVYGECKDAIARRDEIIARLKEAGDRLASTYVIEVFPHEWVCRGGCHHWARFGEQIEHSPDCPITLHRALMKELEEE
jgi:chromosome segregation ATPase